MSLKIEIDELLKLLNDSGSPVFFVFATLAMLLIFLISVSVFLYNRNKRFFTRRDLFFQGVGKKYKIYHIKKPWILGCFFWSSTQIYDILGLDSLVMLRTTRLFLILSGCISLVVLTSLVPLHVYFSNPDANIFIRTSVFSMQERSNYMVAHLFIICFITSVVCVGLYYQWKEVTTFRQQLFCDDPVSSASLLFSDFSTSQLQGPSVEEDLTKRIRQVSKESSLVKVHLLRDINLIKSLIKKHNRLVLKRYETLDLTQSVEGGTALHNETFRYSENSSNIIDNKLKQNYDKLKQRAAEIENSKLNAAVVVFSHVSSAQIFRCVGLSLHQDNVRVSLLPEPTGLIWSNLQVNPHIKKMNSGLIWFLAGMFILFSSLPVAAVGSVRRVFIGYYAKNFNITATYIAGSVKFSIEVLIPLLLMQLFLFIQHRIFKRLSTCENHVSYAEADFSILKKMCIFNAVNTFFIYTISFTYLVFLPEIFQHPFDMVVKLVPLVPLQTNFYMIFLIFQGLVILPWILLKGDDYIVEGFAWIWAKITSTPRVNYAKIEDRLRPTSSYYIYKYSYLLLIFGVGLVFIVLTPLIALAWVPYFILAYVIFAYDEERNNINLFLYRGEFWPIISNVIIAYLVFMQIITMGIFITKKLVLLPTLLCPVIVLTIAYSQYLKHKFRKNFTLPTQETLNNIEILEETEIDEKLKQYYISAFIPPANKTSNDIRWEYIKERELML